MGTRAVIEFKSKGVVGARLYQHCDGYPDGAGGVMANLDRFFGDVEAQCGDDTRFNDPGYLAAKWIVWKAAQYATARAPLNFHGVGVLTSGEPGECGEDYVYEVYCADRKRRPIVKYR